MGKLDNPTATTAKWVTAMQGASTAYQDGIDSVQTAPGQLAAAASAKWLARTQAAVTKFEKNSASVQLADWKTLAKTKGAPRLGSGASAAQSKVLAFQNSFFAYLKAGQARIDAMPTDTIDMALAKANEQARYNAAYPGYRS